MGMGISKNGSLYDICAFHGSNKILIEKCLTLEEAEEVIDRICNNAYKTENNILIKSQDGKSIISFVRMSIGISKNSDLYEVCVYYESSKNRLGSYTTEEKAINALYRICINIELGEEFIKMPQNNEV